MNKGLALVFGSALLALAACTAATDDADSQEQDATPIDRMLIGEASAYPADATIRENAATFDASMLERRKMAWSIIEKVITPVTIGGATRAQTTNEVAAAPKLPRFQTWHAREEILPMFDRLFRGLGEADRAARAPFPADAVAAVFPWNAERATSLASFTQERLEQRRRELETPAGLASLGKDQRVLMSPEYVTHLFDSYRRMLDCKVSDPIAPDSAETPKDPETSEAFAPCLAGEFPDAAVAIKTRWMPSTSQVPVYDTSAAGLRARLEDGTFPEQGDGPLATPDPSQVYTMQLTPDTTSRLVAMHIMTKELRDWVWITMWWSPTPNEDFGADRPASITGTFANYKMCVVTAYDEKDKAPGTGLPRSLADAVDAANDGPATWCSNPYLETAEHSAKTNCIGCHQNGGTPETTETILAQDAKFPDHSRKRVRNDFPADYAFTTTGGLELASEFRNRIEAVSPTPPPSPSPR